MLWILIGSFVGIILGLTGAGGALVAIPLFLHVMNMSLEQATFLSLLVVVLGAGVNYFFQEKRADYKITFGLWIFSFLGSIAGVYVKPYSGPVVTAVLLFAIAIYGLMKVWEKRKTEETETRSPLNGQVFKSVISGIGLGLLTTLTGLGGGVLIVPLLISQFHLSYEAALPTSLLLIFFISLLSFGLQLMKVSPLLSAVEFAYLLGGIILAVLAVKKISSFFSKRTLDLVRKIVFTLVVIYSLLSIGQKVLV